MIFDTIVCIIGFLVFFTAMYGVRDCKQFQIHETLMGWALFVGIGGAILGFGLAMMVI